MSRYLLHISYCGAGFRGWQRQPDVSSVQGCLEQHLSEIYGQSIALHGCGRTDAGVHALQFFAHADLPEAAKCGQIDAPGIYLHDCVPVPADFHAQHNVLERTYSYLLHLDDRPGWQGLGSRFYEDRLQVDLLQKCANLLQGHLDFRALCRQPDVYRSTICNIEKASWKIFDDQVLRFDITADRFLRGMVRILVQRMWEVAQGKSSLEEWNQMLAGQNLKSSLRGAYPDGLYLHQVTYSHCDVPVIQNKDLFGATIDYLVDYNDE